MKNLLFILLVMFINLAGRAQSLHLAPKQPDIYVGLDVVQSIPSFLLGSKYFIQNTVIVEPSVRIEAPKPRKSYVITAGFTSGSTDKLISEHITIQRMRGISAKFGFETRNRNRPVSIGFGPVISWATFSGTYYFRGPAFGDYYGHFQEKDNFALGMDGYLTYDAPLGEKMSIRFLLKTDLAFFAGTKNPYYFPGLGITAGSETFILSPGFSILLFYKVK